MKLNSTGVLLAMWGITAQAALLGLMPLGAYTYLLSWPAFWLAEGVLLWAVCGVLAYGIVFAYWQREFPELAAQHRFKDGRAAWFSACMGPIGLFAIGWMAGWGRKHGLLFWAEPSIEKAAAPSLSSDGQGLSGTYWHPSGIPIAAGGGGGGGAIVGGIAPLVVEDLPITNVSSIMLPGYLSLLQTATAQQSVVAAPEELVVPELVPVGRRILVEEG